MKGYGRRAGADALTGREQEVLALIREELSNEEIARRLGISVSGVKYHVTEILGKLGLENRHDAARWQPEEPRRAWAALPLLFRPRWLSPAIAGTLAVAVAAGIGLLVWALVAVGSGERASTNAPSGPPATRAELVLDRPSPQFYDIDFASDDEGWMLAGGGLLHSTDGGDSWSEIARVSGAAIDFADSEQGWIVGSDGMILATADGGKTWSSQASGTEVHLSDVFAVSEREVWAVGSGQGHSDNIAFPLPTVLLHTTDGGTIWTSIPTPAGAWFSELTFAGDQGWVLGSSTDGLLLHTTDGGRTWAAIEAGLPDLPESMTFADSEHGWVVASCLSSKTGCTTSVYRTEDGGQTWLDSTPDGYRWYSTLAFRDARMGWVVATEDKDECPCGTFVLETADGGKTWERRAEVPTGANQFTWSLQARGDRLYVLGSQLALVSKDSGRSLEAMRQPAVSLGNLDFVDASVGFTVIGQTLLRSNDGGLSWQSVGTLPGYAANIDFVDADFGFASVSGKVSKTTDGGRTWEAIFDGESPLGGGRLYIVDRRHGWLIREEAAFVTEDGGASWRDAFPEQLGRQIAAFRAVDSQTAWAVVELTDSNFSPRRLIRTTNGGRAWQTAKELEPYDGSSFDAANSDVAWLVSEACTPSPCRAALSRTTDGGRSWSETDLGPAGIQDIEFTDDLHGWISHTRCSPPSCIGELLRTMDGGLTWIPVPLTGPHWGDVIFVDAATGWLQPQSVGQVRNEPGVNGRTLLYRIR